MAKAPVKTATPRLSEKDWTALSTSERKEIENVLQRMSGVRDVNQEYVDHRTLGQRAAIRANYSKKLQTTINSI